MTTCIAAVASYLSAISRANQVSTFLKGLKLGWNRVGSGGERDGELGVVSDSTGFRRVGMQPPANQI